MQNMHIFGQLPGHPLIQALPISQGQLTDSLASSLVMPISRLPNQQSCAAAFKAPLAIVSRISCHQSCAASFKAPLLPCAAYLKTLMQIPVVLRCLSQGHLTNSLKLPISRLSSLMRCLSQGHLTNSLMLPIPRLLYQYPHAAYFKATKPVDLADYFKAPWPIVLCWLF